MKLLVKFNLVLFLVFALGFIAVGYMVRKGGITFQMYDRTQHKMIWSSGASGTLKEKRGERFDQLDKSLIKIFDAYPPRAK